MLNDFLDLAVYNLIINKTICEGAIIMDKVILKQEKVTIPTYEISDYDKNPMFLENVYIKVQADEFIRTLYARVFRTLRLIKNTTQFSGKRLYSCNDFT